MALEQILARVADQHDRLGIALAADPVFRTELVGILSELLDEGLDVRVTVRRKNPEEVIESYRASAADNMTEAAQDKKDVSSEDRAVTSTVEAWHAPKTRLVPSDIDACMRKLGELTNSHWGDRDPMTLLPFLKTAGVENRVLNFAVSIARQGRSVAVLHTDLDHFKQVNTEFGEPRGDAVLAEFADRFRGRFSDMGIVLRKGGEEFSAVLFHENPVELLLRAEEFRKLMQTEPLIKLGRTNTCSIGLAIYPEGDIDGICGTFDDLSKDARDAEQQAKDAGRNCIRLPAGAGSLESILHVGDLERAAIEARVGLNRTRPTRLSGEIGAVLGEIIAAELVSAEPGATSPIVERAAMGIGLSFGRAAGASSPKPHSVSAIIPVRDWAAIVAWAYLRSVYIDGKAMMPQDELAYEIAGDRKNGTELFLSIKRGSTITERVRLASEVVVHEEQTPVAVGKPWYPSTSVPDGGVSRWDDRGGERSAAEAIVLSPCLLLPIGDGAILLAKSVHHLVAGVVEIDDRPVVGGGLPDFWQSNVARVIRACLRNPNVKTIIAIGKAENAPATLARLELARDLWMQQLHDLQRRLSISSENLQIFQNRTTRVVRIEEPTDGKLIRAILDATLELPAGVELGQVVDLGTEAKRRRLALASPSEANRLLVTDGLRTGTLADAYPQAVDLLRTSSSAPQTETTQRRFREFPCFKLVLTKPFLETVPDYWKSEGAALKNYYDLNFGRQNGLFGAPLHSVAEGSTSLYAHGIKTTLSALQEGRPTRRVMLPINSLSARLDQPLGLCAIQVMPRLRDGHWYLDFHWIWRTVEALVGFPFSAYGSITWSKDFFDAVTEQTQRLPAPVSVELGELTYLALSFHMFLDVGDTEIARAIVQDASP
jgi:diguanylate cyclase (GGDEF)-like protein